MPCFAALTMRHRYAKLAVTGLWCNGEYNCSYGDFIGMSDALTFPDNINRTKHVESILVSLSGPGFESPRLHFHPSKLQRRRASPSSFHFSGFQWTQSTINVYKFVPAMWYVHLLKCADNFYYTGCTNYINDRINRHLKKPVSYTKNRLPIKLVTFIAFTNKYKAYDFERYLKSGSGTAFRNKRLIWYL